jgi:hypothetical protein
VAAAAAAGSSDEEEELKRALELSRKDVYYISDSDEDMNRAIALSLAETDGAVSSAAASAASANTSAANAFAANTSAANVAASEETSTPTVVVSDNDEFDQMCSNNLSLKERLSKSSLDSEEEAAENSVRILTHRELNKENANLPGPSNITLTRRNQKVSSN